MQRITPILMLAALAPSACATEVSASNGDPARIEAARQPTADDVSNAVQIVWLPATVDRWVIAIEVAAARHRVDPDLLAIMVLVESNGQPRARSSLGARGLMQLMPATAERIAADRGLADHTVERLDDPAYNLDLGAYHVAELIAELTERPLDDEAVGLVAAAYNAGIDRALGPEPLPAETRRYVARIQALWRARTADAPPAHP